MNRNIKALREKKNNYNNNILNYFEKKNLENPVIKLPNNSYIRVNQIKYSQPLSYKFIEENLNKYNNNNKSESKNIISFLKNQREIKTIKEIKIYK